MNRTRPENAPFWRAGTVDQTVSVPDLHVLIPSRLAARIEAYAKENDTDFVHVVIEAIDTFLRCRSTGMDIRC